MEIVAFLQSHVFQCHGSVIIPDHVTFQDPHEGEKEKLGLDWKAERAIMVLSVTKISQLMKRTLVTLTLAFLTTSRVGYPFMGSKAFRVSTKE